MALEYIIQKRRQQRITRLAFGGAIALHVLLFVFFKYTETGKQTLEKIIEIKESLLPPPPPPPPPPDVKADVKAPPKIEMNFSVKTIMNAPSIKADFDVSALGNMNSDLDAPDLTMQAMDFTSDNLTNMVSSAQLPVMNLMTNIGFDVGVTASDDAKANVTGSGKRTSGHTALAVLELPGNETASKWTKGELEAIADFVSRNTSMKVRLGARAVSFTSPFNSFSNWLTEAKKRANSEPKELSSQESEISGQEIMANAMPYIDDGNFEEAKARVKRMVGDYLRYRFDARVVPDQDTNWVKKIDEATPLRDWEKEYLRDAQKSFKDFYGRKSPTGKELAGLYFMLRMFEMGQLPILFCEPQGTADMPMAENMRMLRTYVQNCGFLYFVNTATFEQSRAIVGIINSLTGEKLSDPVGEKTLARLKVNDQDVSGYVFRDPEPSIGHPWIFFPMILPRTTTVTLSIYNKIGNMVYADTMRNKPPGAYLQKNRHYKWYCTDNQGNGVEPGYYVYQISADLFIKTGPVRVSVLKMLPNGKHGVFSSFYPISAVPSKTTVKSEQLSYGEPGVFGVAYKGALSILFTEGYQEKDPLGSDDPAAKEAALKWFTNVTIYALNEMSLKR